MLGVSDWALVSVVGGWTRWTFARVRALRVDATLLLGAHTTTSLLTLVDICSQHTVNMAKWQNGNGIALREKLISELRRLQKKLPDVITECCCLQPDTDERAPS